MRVPASEKVILTLLVEGGPSYGLELVKALDPAGSASAAERSRSGSG